MEQAHLDKGADCPTLGPHYFAARDVAEKFMAQFQEEWFAPLVRKFADELYDKAREHFETFLLDDTENNLQSAIWRGIDDSMNGILCGERWAIDRYSLQKYNGERVREAIAKHIPKELQDARIADLESEVARLRQNLEFQMRR